MEKDQANRYEAIMTKAETKIEQALVAIERSKERQAYIRSCREKIDTRINMVLSRD